MFLFLFVVFYPCTERVSNLSKGEERAKNNNNNNKKNMGEGNVEAPKRKPYSTLALQ